jgi:hypothetical protein
MTIPFFAHCLLKLIEGETLSDKEFGGIEALKKEVEKQKVVEKPVEKPKKAEKVEKPKGKKTERRLDLPDGTEIYTSVAGNEFISIWNQEDQSFTMDGKTYTSPTTWVKACIVIQKGEAYSINGWAAAYIKNKDKRVYLKNL